MQISREHGNEEQHQTPCGIRSGFCGKHADGAQDFKDTADVHQGQVPGKPGRHGFEKQVGLGEVVHSCKQKEGGNQVD